ncbi:flavin reductase [Klebsiella indica]|uniref:Flavin reductase n=1 Tax=Klebsiella indica TaxID=2582917 RepID=A0A5R9LD41_9ENTR|nr:flavin reductase [Klebsiella indica]TLV10712.1 flavin reductase [Klebsiella indica]
MNEDNSHTEQSTVTTPPTKEQFRDAMSQVCSAVAIITTEGPAGRGGFTATSVCSLSDDPPSLLVCMRHASAQYALFIQNRHFCVNVLSSAQANQANFFAMSKMEMKARYASGDWCGLTTGSPTLKNALVNFDCELVSIHDENTHSIFIGKIVAIAQWPKNDALVYFNRKYHDINNNHTTM